MTRNQARAALKRIPNLTQFAKESGVPLRTLSRVASDTVSIRASTLKLIEYALKARKEPA